MDEYYKRILDVSNNRQPQPTAYNHGGGTAERAPVRHEHAADAGEVEASLERLRQELEAARGAIPATEFQPEKTDCRSSDDDEDYEVIDHGTAQALNDAGRAVEFFNGTAWYQGYPRLHTTEKHWRIKK